MRSAWLLVLFALLYAALVASHFSKAYIDFGDGNYLYISRRAAEGAVLYRDILVPQPPCHLLVGSWLIRLGGVIGEGVEARLYTVRTFSLLLRLASMWLIWMLARRLFRRDSAAVWAAGLFLIIPVGFWWSLGYQSEHLEIFFLLASFLLLLRWTTGALVGAGVLAALAVSTNMTAVCYVGWIGLFLLVHDWRRALCYTVPVLLVVGMFVLVGEWLSEGHYLENVFFNQVGTFPHPALLKDLPPSAPYRSLPGYVLYKIASEGGDVMAREGVFIAAAAAGLLLYLARPGREGEPGRQDAIGNDTGGNRETAPPDRPPYERSFVGWYAFWSFMAIGFVAKGATMDYIFTIGEPFICLFAAYAITVLGTRLFGEGTTDAQTGERRPRILLVAATVLGLFILFAWPALWIYAVVHNERQYELDAEALGEVQWKIVAHSRPGDAILAPPYYAFISDRNLVEEYSEFFIWDIKYRLEQRVHETTGPATLKVQAIAAALANKAIPVVVHTWDRGSTAPQQIYRIESVRKAIEAHYRPLLPEPIPTLNTQINVLVPKR